MTERVLKVTESVVTVAIVTGVALFTAGYVTGQQMEKNTSQANIDRAFRSGFELGSTDHRPRPHPFGSGATPGIE